MIEITDAGYTIAAISTGLSIMSALVRKAVLDMDKMKEIKEKIKVHQKEMKLATKSGDMKKMQRNQEDMMSLTMENMKLSFKPMIYTFIPFILVFGWLRDQYGLLDVVASVFGFNFGWFWWYFICAMVVSLTVNKVLGVT